MIQIWQGSKFEWEHEILAQKKIIKVCENFYDIEDANLVFSFRIQNADFDCALFTKNRIILIELKKIKGFVSGGESGNWKIIQPSGIEKTIYRNKNPFEQCSICRSVLSKELGSYFKRVNLKDIAKAISAGIVSYPEGHPKDDGKIESLKEKNPWFFYENLSNLKINLLEQDNRRKLPFDFYELDQFIIKDLNCNKEYFIENVQPVGDQNDTKSEKEKAVKATLDTNSIVIAGPGSGKTRYIIERAAFFIKKNSITPEKIAFVTFTNEASNEIKKRLYRDLSLTEEMKFFCCGTIHRMCLQLIEDEERFNILGYSEKPKVLLSQETKERFINFFHSQCNHSEEMLNKLADFYSLSINRFIHSDLQLISKFLSNQNFFFDKGDDKTRTKWYQAMIDQFLSEQISENVIDFDSILLFAYNLLCQKSIAEEISHQCKYIFLDELQDISKIQFEIFKILANSGTKISAVGDPAQAIYGFRGGDVKAFDWFNNQVRKITTFYLPYNFRSKQSIVKVSDQFKNRFDLYRDIGIDQLQCIPVRKGKGEIKIIKSLTETREARDIAQLIKELVDTEKDLSFKDISILYRSKFHLNPNLGPIFTQFQIPYKFKDRQKFSEKFVINKVLIALSYIYSKKLRLSDITSLYFSSPFSSRITYNKSVHPILSNLSKNKRKILNDDDIEIILASIKDIETLNISQKGELRYFQDVLAMRANLNDSLSANILYYYDEIFPGIKTIRDSFEEAYDDDIFKLLEIADQYGSDFESFLKKVMLEFVEDSASQGVTISTIHGAKGCEWEVVFISGLNDSTIKISDPWNFIDQEDNTFYVAMTRAKSKLILSYSEITSYEHVKPSKYLLAVEDANNEYLSEDISLLTA